jgi:hypothetical protein
MIWLADNDFGDNIGDGVAGPVGLLLVVLLIIGTVLLVRDMNKRLKRLPTEFPRTTAPGAPDAGRGGVEHRADEPPDTTSAG